ncbi:MAG TPA: glycosyltransferase family 4 protein [Patescibacteria group bacterium]|nr:glycosyltransferase family 4 protein [Patescibacteria group bacterium]
MQSRILIFSTAYFPLVGGAEVALKEITDRLPERQFDLICAKLRPGLSRTERIGNITIHRAGFGFSGDKYLLPLLGFWKTLWLPKPTFVWSLMASYGGFAALLYTLFHPKARLLLTLQEGDPLEHYEQRAGVFDVFYKKIFSRANSVQAISRFLADWAKRMGFSGVPEIIPNGVDLERFRALLSREERERLRQEYGYSSDDVILVTASRLSLKNGIDDLIQSLAYLPLNDKLLILGEGEDQEKLKRLSSQKGLDDRVRFLGKKTHEELPMFLQMGDVFVRASLSEGLGNAFLEAMALGLPIIGTPVGGIPDFLTDQQTGLFCQPRDPESVAAAVRQLVSDPALAERLVSNGKMLVNERYDWNKIAQEMDRLFSSLCL